MYIEKRKNGTFYLKESVYNPKTKLPKNKSIYLGSNPIQAKEKLKLLTDDLSILEQIPDMHVYEIELSKAIKELQKLNQLKTAGVSKIIKDCLYDLVSAEHFIRNAKEGCVVRSADCPSCSFNRVNYCSHFNHTITALQGNYRDGKPPRCIASESVKIVKKELNKGSLKLPRDFRS